MAPTEAPSIGCCPNYVNKLCQHHFCPKCKLLLQHFLLHSQTALAASSSLFCNSETWRHLWCHLPHLWIAVQLQIASTKLSASSSTALAAVVPSAPSIGCCPNCKLFPQHFLLHPQTALAASTSFFCKSVTLS